MKILTIILTLNFGLFSGLFHTTNPSKLLYKGMYDASIETSVRKLSKKRKKDRHIITLESAFEKANARDLDRITYLKKEGSPDNWDQINGLYRNIKRNQNLVSRVTPLYIKNQGGREADFEFVDVDNLEIESRKKAAEVLYVEAQQLLVKAEAGDRIAARNAYVKLQKVDGYYRNYRDKAALKLKAQELGTSKVHFKFENSSYSIIPANFERELLRMSVADLNKNWVRYYLTKPDGLRFDYEVVANIKFLEVGPETINNREYIEEKEISDGYDYALDQAGNVIKDTLGNDIKIERFKTIRATIFETLQFKNAQIAGDLEYFDVQTRELIFTIPVTTDAVFENYASTYRGDKRALTKETLRKLGNSPVPFPSDEEMIINAAESFKPVVKRALNDNYRIVN